ncbi:MAG TPA: PadR family transcriptional regulator [Edaphobacter sp.]|nr:PadR family transcriptional regulator [Edaphobacter sp.]
MKPPSPLGEFEQVVLLAALRLEDNAYGVSIRQEILKCTRRKVAPGALYTTLERLESKGLVSSKTGHPTPERGGRAKRFYTVTTLGYRQIQEAQQSFHRLLTGLNVLGEQPQQTTAKAKTL